MKLSVWNLDFRFILLTYSRISNARNNSYRLININDDDDDKW